MLPTTFRSIWPSCFRVEDFQKSTNQKQELPVAAMFVYGSGQNEQSLQRTAPRCFLPSFISFGQAVSEKRNFLNQPIRNKSRLWRPCLLTNLDEMSNLYRGPFIDPSYQVNRRRMPSDGNSSHCLWQGELINMLHYYSLYQHYMQLISKGDNDKSYLSFNSLGKSYLSFNRGEDFLEIN